MLHTYTGIGIADLHVKASASGCRYGEPYHATATPASSQRHPTQQELGPAIGSPAQSTDLRMEGPELMIQSTATTACRIVSSSPGGR